MSCRSYLFKRISKEELLGDRGLQAIAFNADEPTQPLAPQPTEQPAQPPAPQPTEKPKPQPIVPIPSSCPKCEECPKITPGWRRGHGRKWGYADADKITGFGTCPACARGKFLWRGPINDNPYEGDDPFAEGKRVKPVDWAEVVKTKDESNDDLDASYPNPKPSHPYPNTDQQSAVFGGFNSGLYAEDQVIGSNYFNRDYVRSQPTAPFGSVQRAVQQEQLFTPATLQPEAIARLSFYSGKFPSAPGQTVCPNGTTVGQDRLGFPICVAGQNRQAQAAPQALNPMQQSALAAYQAVRESTGPTLSYSNIYV